jgi:GNAT superfamily N-acetyltransferase/8-oxo-dGTP pyrophosphatase MutT (NUDIX family)
MRVHSGISDIVYHKTLLDPALSIIQEDKFRLSSYTHSKSDRLRESHWYYLSTTRSVTGFKPDARTFGVCLVLDGRKLGQKYKAEPLDYWEAGPQGSEQEDRVWSNSPTLDQASKYISEIHVNIDGTEGWPNYNWQSKLRKLVLEAKKKNIDLYLYDDNKAFNLLNKSKAVGLEEIDFESTVKDEYNRRFSSRWNQNLESMMELIQKPVDKPISKEAYKLFYNMTIYDDTSSSLSADLHNLRSGDKDFYAKVNEVLRKANLKSAKEACDFIKKKYKDVNWRDESRIAAKVIASEKWAKEGYTFEKELDGDVLFIIAYTKDGEHAGGLEAAPSKGYKGKIYPLQVVVDPGHRRKGLATQMYAIAEEHFKMPFMSGHSQSDDGKKFRESYNQLKLLDKYVYEDKVSWSVNSALDKGYNSYGEDWTPLAKIKKLEVTDRGNDWFDDSKLDLDKTLSHWVTADPRDAALYNVGGTNREILEEMWDDFPEEVPEEFEGEIIGEDWEDLVNIAKNPTEYCTEIQLTGAVPVIEHDEYFGKSYLYIKPVYLKEATSADDSDVIYLTSPGLVQKAVDESRERQFEGYNEADIQAAAEALAEHATLSNFKRKWELLGVEFFIAERGNKDLFLSGLLVPKEDRNNKVGSKFMTELCEYADLTDQRIVLSPGKMDGAGTTSISRLKDFYKRFGFVENKGRNKDYRISETMFRRPASAKATSDYSDEGRVGEHWGSQASGVLFKCGDKILLLKRSEGTLDPGLWGIPGGAVPIDENSNPKDIKQSALDEAKEEMGSIPAFRDTGKKSVFEKGTFKYTTFLLEVQKEFTPTLNWEHSDSGWFSLNSLPAELHPGVKFTLNKILTAK